MLKDQIAIVGIGATEFSKSSGRSELVLALEAIRGALDDCGIAASEVDGLVTYTLDATPEYELVENLGIEELSFFSRIPGGGGAAGACLLQAAMAIVTGAAKVVIVYRALNGRSGVRFGEGIQAAQIPGLLPNEVAESGSYGAAGLIAPAHLAAMVAQRYMSEYGVTSEDLGRVTVAARSFAATNPKAVFFGRPITLEDHQSSPWIAEPLRRLDCCMETDGAQALVLTSVDRGGELPHPLVTVAAAAQGTGRGERLMSFYRSDLTSLPSAALVARQLYESTGIGADDIQTVMIYDHFTPFVLMQIESYGFCGRGEAKDLLRDGAIGPKGWLPVNTNGGQLGEAYIHGINGIAEGVRQLRGTSCNQLGRVNNVLVTAGVGVATSGAILGRGS